MNWSQYFALYPLTGSKQMNLFVVFMLPICTRKLNQDKIFSKKPKLINNKGQSVINDKADETEHQQKMNLQ